MEYKCCEILKHGLCFYDNVLVSCCFSPRDQINKAKPPIIINDYKGEIFSKEFLFEKINSYVDMFKQGDCPIECENCYHLKEKEWDEGKYIDYITITHFSKCNADCIYCTNNLQQKDRRNDYYNIMPILRSLKEQGIIKSGAQLHIGGGEFTIYKEADEILDEYILSGYAKAYIPTNAIIYSKKLEEAIKKECAYIIVSLDSGCRKTYKKIKRVDKFDSVVKNLKQYVLSKKEYSKFDKSISLKYIIIPKINDSYKEFNKFLDTAKDIGINNIIIDIDAQYARKCEYKINNYLLYFARNLMKRAQEQGFMTEMYSFLKQCEQIQTNKENNFKVFCNYLRYKFNNKQK